MMNLFLANAETAEYLRLSSAEARHATRVLRLGPGAELHAIDGEGTYFWAELLAADDKGARARIRARKLEWGEPAVPYGLVFAPPKSRERLEWIVEKGTELGAAAFWPVFTERSERTRLNLERLQRLLVAATKQCLRSRIPALAEPVPFAAVLAAFQEPPLADTYAQRLIAHMQAGPGGRWPDGNALSRGGVVAIGPEGGFTAAEVTAARAAGFRSLWLGGSRLRTETAAVFAMGLLKQAAGH